MGGSRSSNIKWVSHKNRRTLNSLLPEEQRSDSSYQSRSCRQRMLGATFCFEPENISVIRLQLNLVAHMDFQHPQFLARRCGATDWTQIHSASTSSARLSLLQRQFMFLLGFFFTVWLLMQHMLCCCHQSHRWQLGDYFCSEFMLCSTSCFWNTEPGLSHKSVLVFTPPFAALCFDHLSQYRPLRIHVCKTHTECMCKLQEQWLSQKWTPLTIFTVDWVIYWIWKPKIWKSKSHAIHLKYLEESVSF